MYIFISDVYRNDTPGKYNKRSENALGTTLASSTNKITRVRSSVIEKKSDLLKSKNSKQYLNNVIMRCCFVELKLKKTWSMELCVTCVYFLTVYNVVWFTEMNIPFKMHHTVTVALRRVVRKKNPTQSFNYRLCT